MSLLHPAAPSSSVPPTAGGAPASLPAARVAGLTKRYGEGGAAVRALDGVDVEIERGRFTAVMGPSGSGKSTFLHCVAGLDAVTSGRVWIGDTEITGLSDTAVTLLRRRRVGFVFQSFNLLPTLTAEQNVMLPLELAGVRADRGVRARFDALVADLGLADRLRHRPAELSGGQQQRVAIARALLPGPELVVADEPTGNLDSATGAEVLSLLRASVRERGQSVLMVTHDPAAAAYADRVLLLADGRLAGTVDRPTPESILAGLAGLRRTTAGAA